jgi:putative ABC transport system substrate-binding protein
MRRRNFIALLGGAAAWPLAARAQHAAMPVIGYLSVGSPDANNLAALRKGLREQGYDVGGNAAIEFRAAEQYDQLPALAHDLVRRHVAVIVTDSNINAAQAAKAATTTVPVVFTLGTDPVRVGLVASLNRPAGNITGITYLVNELGPKRLELLRELVPQATTTGFVVNPTNPTTELYTSDMQAAARRIGQGLIVVGASTTSELDAAFAKLTQQRAGGVLLNGDGFFYSRREQIVALAARHMIPAVHFSPEFPAAGGLMSYSDDRLESYRQAGLYVGRILKGEKPVDLPILQPTKFALIVNLKTARALGIEVPPTLLARADEVIE